jgi:apolipoprotein N-acyltransferase
LSAPAIFRVARFKLGAVAFALGALTVLGFAPFYFYFLPPLTVAALFYLWLHAGSRRSAFFIGYLFGLGLYSVGASWVYVSLHDFGMMPMPLAVLSTSLFCAFLALFPACVGWLQAWIKGAPALRLLLVMPAMFPLAEWSLSWVFTGFPWLTLGYTQAPAGPLAGFAPLLGVFGVSWLLALSAGLIALAYPAWRTARKQAWTVLGGLVILWSTGAALNFIAWTHPIGAPVNVSLLQGNIPQEMKWREERLIATLVTYRNLVQASSSELIILPETAIPMFYDQVPENYFAELAQHARNNGGDVILGLPERDADQRAYYNSVISLGAAPTQFYRKQHLVPFGEFIPLKPVFGWIVDKMNMPLSDFSRGTATQVPLKVAGQQVAMDICYEDVFGEEIIRQLPQATLLANVSNDAWFGDSIAPRQHLQISQMRALETGRYMLRATNTGMTAILNEKGRVLAQAPMFRETVLRGTAQGMTGSTPFVRWGNGAFLVLVVLSLAVTLILFSRARQKIK